MTTIWNFLEDLTLFHKHFEPLQWTGMMITIVVFLFDLFLTITGKKPEKSSKKNKVESNQFENARERIRANANLNETCQTDYFVGTDATVNESRDLNSLIRGDN